MAGNVPENNPMQPIANVLAPCPILFCALPTM
jgi:hypothetical protein